MIGVFIVEKFLDKRRVKAKSKLAPDVHGVFFLPPLNRKDTSDMAVDDEFFGVLDDVSGLGALLCAIDHDFKGRFDYDLTVRASVQVTGDVKTDGNVQATGNVEATGNVRATGDVQAGTISLRTHVHSIEGLVVSAGAPPVPIGTGTGTTNVPTGG